MEDVKKYEVLGAEGESIDVNGVGHAAGDIVELTESEAAPLVEAGTVKLVEEAGGGESASASGTE